MGNMLNISMSWLTLEHVCLLQHRHCESIWVNLFGPTGWMSLFRDVISMLKENWPCFQILMEYGKENKIKRQQPVKTKTEKQIQTI